MAATIHLLDTFTDTDFVDLDNHAWDTGGDWKGGADWGPGRDEIFGNEAREILGAFSAGNYRAGSNGHTPAVGMEAFADLIRDPNGAGLGFNLLVAASGYPVNEYYTWGMQMFDATKVDYEFWRESGSGANEPFTVFQQPLADGEGLRFGMTFVTDTTINLWTEPKGGGTRTVHKYGHTVGVSYLDASHQKLGWRKTTAIGSQHGIDNITLQTPTVKTPVLGRWLGQSVKAGIGRR